jgi:hypothetical protein
LALFLPPLNPLIWPCQDPLTAFVVSTGAVQNANATQFHGNHFMEPGPNATLEGIGSDSVQFRAEGGTFESNLAGTHDYVRYECSPYASA